MDRFKKIYSTQADKYHRLIAAEDFENNLLPTLEKITSFADKIILDLGSGTGRIPLLVNNQVKIVFSLDLHMAMLKQQQIQKDQVAEYWEILQGDMRFLPFPDLTFDAITAGWALGHFVSWYQDDWQAQIERVVEEMLRVVKLGGALIIIETLSTGSLFPLPPTPGLEKYYAWLEGYWDFIGQQIQTDYLFNDIHEAVELTEFFFGEDIAKKAFEQNWVQLPEWTGVWGKIKMEE